VPKSPAPVLAALVAAIWLAADSTLSIAVPEPVDWRVYQLHALPGSGTNGIDGYIRGSGIVMAHTDNAVLEWINLSKESPKAFVQVGDYQGQMGLCPGTRCYNSPTQVHMYWEMNSCSSTRYNALDLGVPPTPNYAYYISWNGSFNDNDCGSYYFPIRVGSVTNQPVGTGRMHASYAFAEAALEDRFLSTQSPEHIGTVWFGLDNNAQVSGSYGLHLYTRATGIWSIWNNAGTYAGPGSYPAGIYNPLIYIHKRYYDSFQVTD
jgi:hypothetical protein